MAKDLSRVVSSFLPNHKFEAQTIKIGLINDTYLIKTADANYILQEINHQVFKDIPGLMGNLDLVLNHLRSSTITSGDNYPELIRSSAGKIYLEDNSSYWRLMSQVPDSVSYFHCANAIMLKRGIACMTRFQQALWDFPVESLVKTIPDFHNLLLRFERFKEVVQTDPVGLLKEVESEVSDILAVEGWVKETHQRIMALPDRVTHHDLKFNNVLFNSEDQALCLVDYDTIMPGKIVSDFAEFIRTAVVNLPEDDPNFQNLAINQEFLDVLLQEYSRSMHGYLSPEELACLSDAPAYLTLMLSIRFITDFLEGSKYFKVNYRWHNRDRGRNQLQLFKLLREAVSAEAFIGHERAV